MPFIELRDKDIPEKVLVVNVNSVVLAEARQGTYGPIFRLQLTDGTSIATNYSTYEEAEKIVAAFVGVLGEHVPMITI